MYLTTRQTTKLYFMTPLGDSREEWMLVKPPVKFQNGVYQRLVHFNLFTAFLEGVLAFFQGVMVLKPMGF